MDTQSSALALELVPFEPENRSSPKTVVKESEDAANSPSAISMVSNTTPAEEPPKNGDKYLAAARVEYEIGNVDQLLWDRALTQTKGDREQAIDVYLRSRAVALRVLKKDLHLVQSQSARATANESDAGTEPVQTTRQQVRARAKYKMYGLTAIGLSCAGIIAFVVLPGFFGGNDSSAKAPVAVASKAAPVLDAAQIAAKNAAEKQEQKAVAQELKLKIEQLRAAGNWHVLVPYLAEWTRLEPADPVGWNQLSVAYQQLEQYGDAFDAAAKAAELAPTEPSYWRDVGKLQLQLNHPDKSLLAFEKAASLDDKDAQSLVQAGVLYVQLARLQEATTALDKAQAIVPDNADVMCLKTLIARHQLAAKETLAVARQSRMVDGDCASSMDRIDQVAIAASNTESRSVSVRKKPH